MERPRLLVVDDDVEAANLVQLVAAGCGYDAEIAISASELVQEMSRATPTHIVLDLNMPGRDGLAILHHLSQTRCVAKVLVLSTADSAVRKAVSRLGTEMGLDVAGTLGKPARLATLREALEALKPGGPGQTAAAVSDAIARGEFFLEYQPKMALSDQAMEGAEALIRWRRPSGEAVMPGSFLPHIEQTEVIDELTWFVTETALDQANAWTEDGLDCPISINISAQSLRSLDFTDHLASICANRRVAPQRLMLELTETAPIHDQLGFRDVFARLRLQGFGLSIDDFGTGYASAIQLLRLPFEELKIDRAFVDELGSNGTAERVTRAMIDLAHDLDMKACAEGVQNERALSVLERLGCDLVQGFHIARPMPGADLPGWIADKMQHRRRGAADFATGMRRAS